MARSLHVVPLGSGRWGLRYQGDVTPFEDHETQLAATVAAHNHARMFGTEQVVVHGRDGAVVDGELVDPEADPLRFGDVKGRTSHLPD